MPNLDTLVRKRETEIPSYMQSQVAFKLLTEMDEEGTETYQFIAVFNSGNKEALSQTQLEDIELAIENLREKSDSLGITNILAHTDSEETEKQLVAEDGRQS
ncbi:hypothetical protein UACE39S_03310 [Ureibacillus acetophenoni]